MLMLFKLPVGRKNLGSVVQGSGSIRDSSFRRRF
ncbi:Conserved hypothetical protein [Prochlorococcus marinus str. MIT 9303]|uniref:Uncharacterized protein n=1 Tax=Prochlorococcus marinus (strain MIT 9303) TaxID=59922 RepID=A2CCF0_PROM3|nr:Conserved hypothetical protein [Prochlorococcus marinus str. MIT 9303]